mmetsp:Transcript_60064/g.105106  ORF Transcript_60064/g.105106 Transcript_60064/m.105106 type:complete len:165 (+) Transcript_60064:113-607(+)
MMQPSARKSTTHFFAHAAGLSVVAVLLTSVALFAFPGSQAETPGDCRGDDCGPTTTTATPSSDETRKPLMRREPPRQTVPSPPRPSHWGRMMRREEPLTPPPADAPNDATATTAAGSYTHLVLLVIFAAVAIVGFAMQARGAVVALLGSPQFEQYLFNGKKAKN